MGMPLINWLQKSSSFFGISSFHGDSLEVTFLEKKGAGYRLAGREALVLASGETLTQDRLSNFRNRLSHYQVRSPVWIHLVMRNSGFVKVFSLSPGIPTGEVENAVSKRIQEEIPYLSEEVVMHQTVRPASEGKAVQVLLFGVSKAVLADQMTKLETYGIIPDRVMLSTEILNWLYWTRIVPAHHPDRYSLLVYPYGSQVELLFFEDLFLLQSRWVSEEGSHASTIRDAIRASSASLEREWRQRPNQVLLLESGSGSEVSIAPDPSLQIEKVSIGPGSASELAPLLTGAADVYPSGQVFDFTLPSVKESREKERRAGRFMKLAASIACLALSVLLLASVQVGLTLAKTSWFRIQIGVLNQSVKEVKALREQALLVRDFQEKKSLPLKLLAVFRKLIPSELLLDEFEYSESQSLVRAGGKAPEQSQVDQFVAALEKDPVFEKLWLEGVQAERGEQGKSVFHFSLKGAIKANS